MVIFEHPLRVANDNKVTSLLENFSPFFELYPKLIFISKKQNYFSSLLKATHADVHPVSLCRTTTRHAIKTSSFTRQMKWKAREITKTIEWKNTSQLLNVHQMITNCAVLEIVSLLAAARRSVHVPVALPPSQEAV